jgi:hypothetical protein
MNVTRSPASRDPERMTVDELIEEDITRHREIYRRAGLLPECVPCTTCGDEVDINFRTWFRRPPRNQRGDVFCSTYCRKRWAYGRHW